MRPISLKDTLAKLEGRMAKIAAKLDQTKYKYPKRESTIKAKYAMQKEHDAIFVAIQALKIVQKLQETEVGKPVPTEGEKLYEISWFETVTCRSLVTAKSKQGAIDKAEELYEGDREALDAFTTEDDFSMSDLTEDDVEEQA